MSYFVTAAGSVLMSGPTGIMVPLMIETVPGLTLAQIYMYYNYIAVCLMVFVAAMAGSRSESRYLIVVPILGGIFTWFGWVHAPDQAKWVVMLIIAGLLGIFSYINDVNHEKYGISGPGSKLLNLVFFIILFQVAVGCINGFDLFPAGNPQPTPNTCTVGYQCDAYGNINLESSVGSLNNSGGIMQDVLSIVSNLGTLAVTMLKFIVTILTSVALFSVVLNASLNGAFPGIAANTYYLLFLALVQVGIWAVYALTLFTWYYKPMPGEGTL